MESDIDVSVVVSTYNRSETLRGALESLLAQENCGTRYEVIVVDNNSADQTLAVVTSFMVTGDANLFYSFEPKQGISHARNNGIAVARAPIVAFMDDDVKPLPNWIRAIKIAFDEFPDVDCIGGKVLPESESQLPLWLTKEHWTPLALLDYGEKRFYLEGATGPGLVGANLAVRAALLKDVGGFSPELQRVKDSIGSMEDHEFLLRVFRLGKRVMYIPEVVVKAQVFPERLKKSYHRKWYKGHGGFYAMMRAEDFELSRMTLLGVPSHLYKRALANLYGWLKYLAKGRFDEVFRCEIELSFFWGFFRKRISARSYW